MDEKKGIPKFLNISKFSQENPDKEIVRMVLSDNDLAEPLQNKCI